MKIHKRYSEKKEDPLLAVCTHGPRAPLLVEEDLTDDDELVTCGNCRRIARVATGYRPTSPGRARGSDHGK